MITPEEFRTVGRRELERYHQIEDSFLRNPYSGLLTDRPFCNDYIGEIPTSAEGISFNASESFNFSNSERHTRVIIGVEYLIRLDPTTFNQSHRLKSAQPRGIIIYERSGETRHNSEYAQMFLNLELERVTYVGYNRFAQEVIPSLLSVEGLNLEEGIARFFEIIH